MRNAVRPFLNLFAVLALASALPVRAGPAAPQAAPFVVNWLLDEPDASTADDICLSTPSAKCTLRAAVQQANFNPGPDTIVLGVGAHLLLRDGSDDTSLNGDLDILSDVTITGAGSDQTTIIQDGLAERVLHVLTGAVLHLASVQVEGGGINGASGGGIFNAGHLSLVEAVVYDNFAGSGDGGGLYNTGVLTLTGSLLLDNNTSGSGGGLYNAAAARATLTDSEVRSNGVGGGAGDDGAGLYNAGTLSLLGSRVAGGTNAHYGGGLYNSGLLTITTTTVENNQASELGGGLYNLGPARIQASTFYSNSAVSGSYGPGVGGGLYNVGGAANLILINTTFSGNRSENGGAAIHQLSGNLNAYNITVARNLANVDGTTLGDAAGVTQAGGAFNLRNSLLAGNFYYVGAVLTGFQDCYGTLGFYGRSFISASVGGCVAGGPGILVVDSDADLLGPLAANGGPTQTHALQASNPARDGTDGGDGYGCVDPNYDPLPTDQRGFPRVSGPRCDAGAYEFTFLVLLPLVVR